MAKAVGKSQNGEGLLRLNDLGEKLLLKACQTGQFRRRQIEELQQFQK
jgi:hypothetical protein